MYRNRANKITFLAIIMFLLASSFYFYEYFLQISPSVMTNELMRDLGINAATLGTVSAFYYYTYTLFQVPAGLLYDRFGARNVLTVAIFVCSLGACLFGLGSHVATVSMGRLLMGAGSAFSFVGTLYLCLRWFPLRYFAVLAGLTQLMGSAGAIAGEAPLTAMNNHFGWHHTMFLLFSIGMCLSLLVFLIVRNQPKNSSSHITPHKSLSVKKSLSIILIKPQTWAIAFYSCFIWAPVTAFAGLWGVPFLAADYNTSTLAAAEMIGIMWLGIAIGSPLIGALSEKIKQRCLPLTGCAFLGLMAVFIVLTVKHPPYWLMGTLLFIMGLAASGQSLAFALIADTHTEKTSSTAMGFNNLCVVCGAIVFQPFIGQLLDLNWAGKLVGGIRYYSFHNFQIALLIVPACYLACMLIATFFIKETHCKNVARGRL